MDMDTFDLDAITGSANCFVVDVDVDVDDNTDVDVNGFGLIKW